MSSFMELFSHPEEGPLLKRLLNDSGDLEARRAYLELLERGNDPRAELMLLSTRLLLGILDDGERRAAALRVQELSENEFDYWARLVGRPTGVRNCGAQIGERPQVRFAFECPQTWGSLRPTDDPKVRFCDQCSSAVTRCDTLAEAEQQAKLGACIAVPGPVFQLASSKYTQMVTGRPDPNQFWARNLFPNDRGQ
jgi:hypothetical protein